jgi:hypothetical protein
MEQRSRSVALQMCQNLPMARSKPGAIHLRIVNVMKRFPGGISGGQIRQELEKEGLRPEDQTHLDRRKRDLKKRFIIKAVESRQEINGKPRKVTLYKYAGKRKDITDEGYHNIRIGSPRETKPPCESRSAARRIFSARLR